MILSEQSKKSIIELTIMIIEGMIKDIETQGGNSITTNDLRKFIHNMETDTKVIGKTYGGKIDA